MEKKKTSLPANSSRRGGFFEPTLKGLLFRKWHPEKMPIYLAPLRGSRYKPMIFLTFTGGGRSKAKPKFPPETTTKKIDEFLLRKKTYIKMPAMFLFLGGEGEKNYEI